MIAAGTRLGPYVVSASIGSGGMGEVYKAHDPRLGRDVAVKVLPAGLSADVERLTRFEQEARAAAALNHPNILAVYDIGQHDGAPYIVSELLEGETLRERLNGGALPVRKAVEYAIQIAHGLAAAHEKGIVHRDLKPENVFITADSRVKILDFGLAKLTQAEPALAGLTQLPTTPPNTLPGVVLGTIGYMAPEQVRGLAADHRSDIFAFGAIVYEMLSGRRAFSGETAMDTMTAILKEDPAQLPIAERQIPPTLTRIVDRCLERSPATRFQTAIDLAFALEASLVQSGAAETVRLEPIASRRWVLQSWIAAAIVLFLALAALSVAHFREVSPTPQSVRFQIPPPGASAAEMFALSPDGRYLAFVANTGGLNRLWVRAMDALDARALAGTEGAAYPFWSPDGANLGFFAEGKLKKITVAGGPPITLCDAIEGRGGTWNREGVILFSAGPTSPILRVSAAGGTPTSVTELTQGDFGAGDRFPVFLPDGVHFLYNVSSDRPDVSGVYIGSLQAATRVRVLADTTNAFYAPGMGGRASGYLVFRRDDTLMAQPFDGISFTAVGDMFPLADQVPNSVNAGFGAFSMSESGTLAYRTGGSGANRELLWMDRTGKRLRPATRPATFSDTWRISPNQQTLAVRIINGSQSDIWLQDLTRDVISRFTFRPGISGAPVWSPFGDRVAFFFQRPGGSTEIYVKRADGNSQEELLWNAGVNGFPEDWSPDGKWIVYRETAQKTSVDLWLLPMEGDRKPISYLQTPFIEMAARFSPGPETAPRWIAFQSNESGQNQVYVQSIPASGAKYQISTTGGTRPVWRSDGKELFYLSTDQKVMAVPVALGTTVQPGTPQELFADAGITGFAPSADGQRFLVNIPARSEGAGPPPITIVLNWTADLKK